MASSGKKGKKNKGTVISLQSFLSNGENPVGTTQVAKNIRNVDGEDSDDGANVLTVVCQLPTAPRANRIFDDNSVPHTSPFIAYVTNLPFDVKDDDIYEYFDSNRVISVRLPREDGESGRVRGFGYVEFESRADLIHALGIPDPTIKGRRIRIDLSHENDQNSRQRGSRRGYESNNSEIRESTNWRRDNIQKKDPSSFGFERSFNKDLKSVTSDNNSPGSWRLGTRSATNNNPTFEQNFEKDRTVEYKNHTSEERPKLNLKPRTLPIPELDVITSTGFESNIIDKIEDQIIPKWTGVTSEKVFGSAKPVDTTARDLEIEKRLADIRRQESLQDEVLETTNNLKEICLENIDKVSCIETSWRRQDKDDEANRGQDNRGVRTGRRHEIIKDNRYKHQEKSEGSDNLKDTAKDVKRKEGVKNKRDSKVERQLPKFTQNQIEPALQSSNKYSGLDEASD